MLDPGFAFSLCVGLTERRRHSKLLSRTSDRLFGQPSWPIGADPARLTTPPNAGTRTTSRLLNYLTEIIPCK